MKKIIGLFIVSMMLFSISGKNYEIETSRGLINVVMPDDATPENAFIEMSKLYLEERFDHEDLLDSVKDLDKTIAEYKLSEAALTIAKDKAIKDYTDLNGLYKTKSGLKIMTPFIGLGLNTENQVSFNAGIILFEKVQLSTILMTSPSSIGLNVGILL